MKINIRTLTFSKREIHHIEPSNKSVLILLYIIIF